MNESKNRGKKCPNCPDQGWWVDYDQYGNAEQVQCEFCYAEPESIFNLREQDKQAVTQNKGEK